jgi:transcriptional regulator with XRE-family HTH domain
MMAQIVSTREEFSRWLQLRLFEVEGLRPSIRRLARQAKMSQTTLGAVVRGKKAPTEATARKLAPILRVDVEEVRRRAGIAPLIAIDPDKPTPLPITEDERQRYMDFLEKVLGRLRE